MHFFLLTLNSQQQKQQQIWCIITLQDFIVLPTTIFRRYVIKISSVIYLPTSLLTDYVRWLSFRR